MSGRRAGAGSVLFGGSGFLGSAILRRCPDMVSIGRTPPPTSNRHVPLASFDDLRALDSLPFDSVVFAVGNSDRRSMERPVVPLGEPNAFDHHVIPLLRTLEYTLRRPMRRFIAFSTVLVYDHARARLPVAEDAPLNPVGLRYVVSKLMAEQACAFYARSIPMVTLRLSNMYGPTHRPGFDVVHDLVRDLVEHGVARVRNRRPRRDFVYVDDVACVVQRLIDSDVRGTFNMGTGELTSVGTIVDLLVSISGGRIDCADESVGPPLDFVCDVSRLRSAIDWTPAYSIEAGLRETFATMKAAQA